MTPPAWHTAAPSRTAEALLPATGPSVAAARELVRRELPAWGRSDLVDDCLLIVSELVTNAVRHGGSAIALRLFADGDAVRGEVYDPGDGVPRPRDPDHDSTDGRGLHIVDALTDAWGVIHSPRGGKSVWFVAGACSLVAAAC
ncbi:ATP-binding protein [Streptosporangiaceae bacterium NEAU-GS5]|nr:ATP-binding protein [Streptosporangiaceae bacterium NEAU-GS5]